MPTSTRPEGEPEEERPRKKRSKRPNPNFFKLYADRIRKVRGLLVGVKKADSGKYHKDKAAKANGGAV